MVDRDLRGPQDTRRQQTTNNFAAVDVEGFLRLSLKPKHVDPQRYVARHSEKICYIFRLQHHAARMGHSTRSIFGYLPKQQTRLQTIQRNHSTCSLLLLFCLVMDGLAVRGHCCLLESFSKCGMGVTCSRNILTAGTIF